MFLKLSKSMIVNSYSYTSAGVLDVLDMWYSLYKVFFLVSFGNYTINEILHVFQQTPS